MAKLQIHDTMPDFSCPTPFTPAVPLSRILARVEGRTALVFLRYYGCPICQLDLQEYAGGIREITEAGGQLLVVLQSNPEKLAGRIEPDTFPFDILCDPEMKLYQALDIAPAASMVSMISFAAVKKIIRSRKRGLKHGDYEGNEQQLPAAFVLNRDREVLYAHYGTHAADIPDAAALAELLK